MKYPLFTATHDVTSIDPATDKRFGHPYSVVTRVGSQALRRFCAFSRFVTFQCWGAPLPVGGAVNTERCRQGL